MRINLTRIRTYYINMHSDKQKNKNTKNLLESLGFKSITRCPGFKADGFISGSGAAYQNVLMSRCARGEPFTLVEDDIKLTHFDHIIDVPDDADAVYLGVSKMGFVDGKHEELLLVSNVEGYEHLYRIHNMLATHAVVYLNMDYVKSTILAAQNYLEQGLPHDLGIAENMQNWKVYALNKPMFIQYPKYRYFTDTSISDLPNTQEVV